MIHKLFIHYHNYYQIVDIDNLINCHMGHYKQKLRNLKPIFVIELSI
jgi:hypothetical protein